MLAMLLLAQGAWGQDGAKKPAESGTGKGRVFQIPAELAAAFWHAAAEFNAIAPKYQQAEAALKARRAELEKACGEQHTVQAGSGPELICVAKEEMGKEKK
jgi:hypothetical protein